MFVEIVVGAPYEEDGKGGVYVFNGWSSGIWPKYTQHIKASKINGLLRGFGISCSRPMAVQNKTGKQKHCRIQKGFRSWNSFFSWTNELIKNFK